MSRRLALLVFTFLTVLIWISPVEAAESDASLVEEVMTIIREYHLSNPDPDDLTRGAINGMLETLDDPYAQYFTEEELKDFTGTLNGDLVGVGIEIRTGDKHPFVVRVFPGTPAERGGLVAGDIILAVDGQSTEGRPLPDVAQQIRGPRGTQVILTLQRGGKEFDVVLQRAEVHVPSVEYEMLAGGTGYVKVTSFGTRTAEEFDAAMRSLQADGMLSLIIDLRDNGGGYLQECVDVVDNFLAEGTLVVSTVDGRGNREKVITREKPLFEGLPMVVLINGLTASASEILAGALQDYGVATLVGETTFGKGVVQTIIPVSSGGALKLTISKYLTPAGKDIDSSGLQPDYSVLTDELQKEVAWQLLHPEDDPDLAFIPGSGKARVNGREIDLPVDVLQKDGKEYLPLRIVLEALACQVFWRDGLIEVHPGGQESMVFDIRRGNEVFLQNGISYLPVNLLPELNITVTKKQNNYLLVRELP